MKIDLSQFLDTFLQESSEHILEIERGLLQLKSCVSEDEALSSIFRAAHSIKGGAGTFGLNKVVRFTHVLENLFDEMRGHRIDASAELVALLLRANDVLKELITSKDESAPDDAADILRLLENAAAVSLEGKAGNIHRPSFCKVPQPEKPERETHYSISFRPASDLFLAGSDPLLLLRNLAVLGKMTSVKVDRKELPSLRELASGASYLSWEINLTSPAPREELEEIFEFVLDCATVDISEKAGMGIPATEEPAVSEPERIAATEPSEVGKPAMAAKPQDSRNESASVRVPTEKIDQLIDIVGEIVIAHSITARMVEGLSCDVSVELQESVASLGRHIRDLHERTMAVRMLPLGSLFSRFNRLIHDLAEKTGKQLRLITEGDDTEVDRSIFELLGDPLTHVLRNSADHGIETPDIRRQAGKSPEGTIVLRASHQAGTILIEVIDDGAGLNLARIRNKAISRNLIPPDAALTDEQLRLLIFEPGFSTKDQVSDISGRGVGMDVVKKNVAAFNGSISLASEQGIGTHIRIMVPLTLAIMEGLIVRVASQSFVLPLISILETVCLDTSQIRNIAGQGEVAIIREEVVPFLRLRKMFNLAPSQDGECALGSRYLVLVVETGKQRAALAIDEVLGQQQIVVKSLERNFARLEGTLGATILGDGKAALILDAPALMARQSSRRTNLAIGGRMSLVA